MGLPVACHFVDRNRNIRTAVVKPGRDSGYRPDPDYHPTYRVVRCSICGNIGHAIFQNGFNLRDGDRLMAGKGIAGECWHCNRQDVELIPVPVSALQQKEFTHLAKIQEALDTAIQNGEPIPDNAIIWPKARVQKYAEFQRRLRVGQA